MDRVTLASMIDQTLLDPTLGPQAAASWVSENANEGFAALCVPPYLVPLVRDGLSGTGTRVCSVVGFPLGYSATDSKVDEAVLLAELGCDEIDMVMNVGAFLEGHDAVVADEVRRVVESVRRVSDGRGVVKVIIETGSLRPDEIGRAARLVEDARADFVKTSTGFGPRGASVDDVVAIRAAVGPNVGIKASGGIRDLETALAMIEAGADRIGTSSGREILAGLDEGSD